MRVPFEQDDLILFTGDSITDCLRDRNDPLSLGMGYAAMISGRLGLNHAELDLRFRNTGISGNRNHDLLARWDTDCLALEPDWVSLLLGVNNTLWRYCHNDPTTDDVFESEYRMLLQRLKDETAARVVLCSPFLLHIDSATQQMREDLDPKIAIIRNLADEFGALWVDYDAAFISAQTRHIPAYWAPDGVHPSIAGHALMADTWLAMVEG